ncbi:1797_t:CDS:2 [Entrophospora sp. SA101]|nr:1797_t:CDS:2 [Entrophospora sp. SA101]
MEFYKNLVHLLISTIMKDTNRNNCLKIKNIIQGFEEIENIVMNLSTNTIIG